MADIRENCIEWITGDKYISCTFTQKRYITKVRKLADRRPDLVPNFHENTDGSIWCRIPLKALKLYLNTRVHEGVEEYAEE